MRAGGIIERVIKKIKERKVKLEKGGVNSIPSPFFRFREDFIGIERKKYYIVTANTKVGKTQIASYLFLYNSIFYAYKNPDKVRLKIFYYPLEEDIEDVVLRFLSYCLNTVCKTRISPGDLMSSRNISVDDVVIEQLEKHKELEPLFDFFEDHVEFSSSRNPTGVYNEVKMYCEEHGQVFTKKKKVKNDNGDTIEVEAFDYYKPDDEDEYVIAFLDHISLVQLERGMTLKQSADKLSEYCVLLRNRYSAIPVIVQQQTADKEGLDAFKERKLKPDANGVADTKYTVRDCNCLLGLFSPARHDLPEYWGYDITRLRDNARFLEVIVNRGMPSGGVIGLFFDGATCNFAELPRPNDATGLGRLYAYLDKLGKTKQK